MKRQLAILFTVLLFPIYVDANEGGGFSWPEGLRLNGKFDVNYERTGYSGNPREGQDAIKNYHHFLFLSRKTSKDPFFFSGELIDRYFYEFGATFKPDNEESPLSANVKAGKVVVPFGGEPTFHHSYGGLSGFDQQILPLVWARHGISGQIRYRTEKFTITQDLYVVHGYRLPSTDAVLDLQTDFSDIDDAKFGFGGRLGFGWGPVSAWVSFYGNPLGGLRRLWLSALDVSIWRIPGVPVLEDLMFSFGAMRAGVSGGNGRGYGGPGFDYYHFGDYAQIRYYAMDWLYIQYRTGLRTTNNRRGFFLDNTREDEKDSTSHNVGVVYKRGGFSTGLFSFWNLEKDNEQDNDFMRVALTYEF